MSDNRRHLTRSSQHFKLEKKGEDRKERDIQKDQLYYDRLKSDNAEVNWLEKSGILWIISICLIFGIVTALITIF